MQFASLHVNFLRLLNPVLVPFVRVLKRGQGSFKLVYLSLRRLNLATRVNLLRLVRRIFLLQAAAAVCCVVRHVSGVKAQSLRQCEAVSRLVGCIVLVLLKFFSDGLTFKLAYETARLRVLALAEAKGVERGVEGKRVMAKLLA